MEREETVELENNVTTRVMETVEVLSKQKKFRNGPLQNCKTRKNRTATIIKKFK